MTAGQTCLSKILGRCYESKEIKTNIYQGFFKRREGKKPTSSGTGKETGAGQPLTRLQSYKTSHCCGRGQNGGKIVPEAGFVRGLYYSGKCYVLAIEVRESYNRLNYKIANHVLAIILFCLFPLV